MLSITQILPFFESSLFNWQRRLHVSLLNGHVFSIEIHLHSPYHYLVKNLSVPATPVHRSSPTSVSCVGSAGCVRLMAHTPITEEQLAKDREESKERARKSKWGWVWECPLCDKWIFVSHAYPEPGEKEMWEHKEKQHPKEYAQAREDYYKENSQSNTSKLHTDSSTTTLAAGGVSGTKGAKGGISGEPDVNKNHASVSGKEGV